MNDTEASESLALISDIHGNRVALDAVFADIERRGISRIVCLGDVVDLGPEPEACVARLMDAGVPCLKGNHDPLDEETEGPLRAVQDWTRDRLSERARRHLEDAPATRTVDLLGHRIFCAHGSPRSATENVLAGTPDAELDVLLAPSGDAPVVVVGHTHVQLVRRRGGRTIVNAGSVGMPFREPFSGAPPSIFRWAEYAIVHARPGFFSVELCRVPYSFDAFVASFAPSFPGREAWLLHWEA